jgi:hypothetical protein
MERRRETGRMIDARRGRMSGTRKRSGGKKEAHEQTVRRLPNGEK